MVCHRGQKIVRFALLNRQECFVLIGGSDIAFRHAPILGEARGRNEKKLVNTKNKFTGTVRRLLGNNKLFLLCLFVQDNTLHNPSAIRGQETANQFLFSTCQADLFGTNR